MHQSLKLFLEALQISFLSIRRYPIDFTHRIKPRPLPHSVFWLIGSGKIDLWVNERKYAALPGHVLLLPPGSSIHIQVLTSEAEITSINFDAEISYLRGKNWTELLHLPVLLSEEGLAAAPIIEEMLASADSGDPLASLQQQGNLQRLTARLLRAHFRRDAAASDPIAIDPRVETIIGYLALHPACPTDVCKLGELVHLSHSYLRKLFIRHTGMAPQQFIHQFKMDQAKQAILQSDEPIMNIALQFGFQDANYFCRLFRMRTGYTPSGYRKKFTNWMGSAE
jgi:AraC-like DNA-binding protein